MEPSQTRLDALLPRADLAASLAAVLSRLLKLQSPRPGPDIEGPLRASLGRFVRRELFSAVTLPDHFEEWRDLLPKGTPPTMHTDDVDTLQGYARRRSSHWRMAVEELLKRLETDWPEIVTQFDLPPDAILTAISHPLGDLHHNGRSVYALTFDGGRALIYKPRPVDAEAAFAWLLSWLHERGYQPGLAACRTLPKGSYGWTEYVRTTLCRTEDDMLSYYRRQGAFLALFWRFCGSDAIGDNVVVSREHPIWIDTECLFRPDTVRTSYDTSKFSEWMRDSMLTTGMVLMNTEARGGIRSGTGLSVSCAADRARIFDEKGRMREPYVQCVVRGFEDTYLWLLIHRKEFSVNTGALLRCKDIPVRVLLRSTPVYAVLLRLLAITPARHLMDTCCIVGDVLRHGKGHGDAEFAEGVVEAEMRALLRGDVPYWSTSTTSLDIWESEGGTVSAFVRLTSTDCLHNRGDGMNERDLSRQVWLLESFLRGVDRA